MKSKTEQRRLKIQKPKKGITLLLPLLPSDVEKFIKKVSNLSGVDENSVVCVLVTLSLVKMEKK